MNVQDFYSYMKPIHIITRNQLAGDGNICSGIGNLPCRCSKLKKKVQIVDVGFCQNPIYVHMYKI